MTASTHHSSPLASAQALRQRHGRLSPLRLGIYGLVSLGSHLLLLGLLRGAWQFQLATQSLGSPLGIDFVEVDLNDGSFAGLMPDESGSSSISTGKLTAAQLNELIASGGAAAPTGISELGESGNLAEDGVLSESSSVGNSNQVATAPKSDSQAGTQPGAPEAKQPRSWFPFGRSKENDRENSGGGLFGDRPLPPLSPSAPAKPAQTEPPVSANTNSANNNEGDRPDDVANASGDASTTSSGGEGASAPSSSGGNTAPNVPSAPTGTEAPSSNSPPASGTPDTSAETTAEPTAGVGASEAQNGSGSGEESSESNGNSSIGGPPNTLPPNANNQPVSPNQTASSDGAVTPDQGEGDSAQPGSTTDNAAGNPSSNAASNTGGGVSDAEGGSGGNTSGVQEGSAQEGGAQESGSQQGAAGDSASQSENPEESAAPPSGEAEASQGDTGTGSETNAGGDNNAPSGLGATISIGQIVNPDPNNQVVVTSKPQPKVDRLSFTDVQSIGEGRCVEALARLTPANDGQTVQLTLGLSSTGEVTHFETPNPAILQTALGQAATCLVAVWPFDPARGEANQPVRVFVEVTLAIALEN